MRAHLYRPIQDNAGNLVLNTSVRVLQPDTEDLILEPIYVDDTGDTLADNPMTVADGVISFYLDDPKVVRLGISAAGQAEQFIDDLLVAAAQIVEETLVFGQQGDIAAVTGTLRFYLPMDCTIVEVRASLGIASSGVDPVIVDVNKNGTSIYAVQADQPHLADGVNTVLAMPTAGLSLARGDYITIDVDQVGSSTPGTGLTVQMRVARSA